MMDFPDDMTIVLLLFIVVFALNIVPAFAPPTWMTLSFVGLTVPSVNVMLLAAVGATAATLGRVGLAKLSRLIVRQKFLSEQARLNVDALKQGIEGGLTSLPIIFLAAPFFIGRILSYGFWVTTASALGDRLNLDSFESSSYLGAYFLVSQLLLVPVMYGFTRIDWHAAFAQRKFKIFHASR
jgi:hypothetical protein